MLLSLSKQKQAQYLSHFSTESKVIGLKFESISQFYLLLVPSYNDCTETGTGRGTGVLFHTLLECIKLKCPYSCTQNIAVYLLLHFIGICFFLNSIGQTNLIKKV